MGSNPHEVADKSAPTSNPKIVRGHQALRHGRASIPNRTYFITACTHRRERLLESPEMADVVFEHLHRVHCENRVRLIASVVMPDHVHAVLTLLEDNTIDSVMKRFRGSSARVLNGMLYRTGSVWQRGYFDRLIRMDERLETILHYLWHNPMPPGLNFRCAKDTWAWFRMCVHDEPEYYDWLKQNP